VKSGDFDDISVSMALRFVKHLGLLYSPATSNFAIVFILIGDLLNIAWYIVS
jgi:hypothetical protein